MYGTFRKTDKKKYTLNRKIHLYNFVLLHNHWDIYTDCFLRIEYMALSFQKNHTPERHQKPEGQGLHRTGMKIFNQLSLINKPRHQYQILLSFA